MCNQLALKVFCAVLLQVKLYNGSAVCNMQMGNFEEAERELLEALNKVRHSLRFVKICVS
jgi:hypothetical protein